MKNLKFRAWNKESESYVEPMTIQEMIHQKVNQFSLEQLNDWFVFEQYTGRKDIDGKDIYVGDILYYVRLGTPINNVIVVQENGDFFTRYVRNQYVKPLHGLYFVSMHYKVIGNIHENKELLKGE